MKLHNGDCLTTTALLEQIGLRTLRAVSQNAVVQSVRVLSPCDRERAARERDWLTTGSGQIWSVALNSEVFIPTGAALVRSQVGLSIAQAIAEGVPEEVFEDADTIIATACPPPAQWSCIELVTSFGSVLCMGVFSPTLLYRKRISSLTSATRRVRVRLVGHGELATNPIVGARVPLRELSLSIPELGIGIQLFVEEKLMVEVDGETQREHTSGAIPVRIDLGSLELSLEEIAALREGHRLELDAQLPTACFLRIGHLVIAEASLEQSDAGLVVRVIKTTEMSATSSVPLSI